MNVKVLGNFLAAIGLIALLVSGYFYRSVNNEEFVRAEAAAAVKRINGSFSGYQEGGTLARKEEKAESRGFIFGAIGGAFLLLGIGLRASAKSNDDRPSA